MGDSLYFTQQEQESEEFRKNYQIEKLTFNTTEEILILMEDKGISKTELAMMLGKSKSCITQLLNGSRDMTLRTLAEICLALGVKPEINLNLPEIPDS